MSGLLLVQAPAVALTFPEWQAANFTSEERANASFSGLNADPDADGISNLAEYARGFDPKVSNSDSLGINVEPSGLSYTFSQRLGTTDLLERVEESSDLSSWRWLTPNAASLSILSSNATTRTVSFLSPNAPAVPKKWFARVRSLLSANGTDSLLAPGQLTATLEEPFAVILGWNDNARVEEGFEIERQSGSGFGVIGEAPFDRTSYRDETVVGSTTNTYRVSAFQGDLLSAPSNEVSITLPLDTDGDGLSDAAEISRFGTDPTKADSDNDGLSDGWEVRYGFNPSVAGEDLIDSDNDTLLNSTEFLLGMNPLLADSNNNGTPDNLEDSDQDGMPNGWEQANGTNPKVNDADEDLDNDGLTNSEEQMIGTKAKVPDTDNDGVWDGSEAMPLESKVTLPRVPEPIYAVVEMKEIPMQATFGGVPRVNSAGQAAFVAANVPYFWSGATGLVSIPVTGEGILIHDLSENGVVLLSSQKTTTGANATTNIESYLWSPSGGLKTLSKVSDTDVGNEIKDRSNDIWSTYRQAEVTYTNSEIQRIQGEIQQLMQNASSYSPSEYQSRMEALQKDLSDNQKYLAFLPLSFNADAFQGAESLDSYNDSKSFRPVCLDQNGYAIVRYAESVGAKGRHGKGFDLSRHVSGWARWDGSALQALSFPDVEIPSSFLLNYNSRSTEEIKAGQKVLEINARGDVLFEENLALINGQKVPLPDGYWHGITSTKNGGVNSTIVYGSDQNNYKPIISLAPTWQKIECSNSTSGYEWTTMSNGMEFFIQETLWRNSLLKEVPLDPAQWEYGFPYFISPDHGFIISDLISQPEQGANKRYVGLLVPVELKDLKKLSDQNDDAAIESIPPKEPDETDNDYIQRPLRNKQIAYIEPHGADNNIDPEMPRLVVKMPGAQGLKVRYKLVVEYKRGNGWWAPYVQDFTRPEDTVKIPGNGQYTAEMAADQEWRIFEAEDWQNEIEQQGFFGGTAKLYIWFPSQGAAPIEPFMTFRIGGKNPDPDIAKAFIQTHLCDDRLWFAYAIAKHESKGYEQEHYNQFFGAYRKRAGNGFDQNKDWQCWAKGWPAYNIDRKSRSGPLTSAGGYGIFQVTGDSQSQWTIIPRREIWNWQDNVGYQKNNIWKGAMGILKSKIQFVDARYIKLQQTYPASGSFPSYPSPQQNPVNRKRFSAWDAYVCKGYNGYGGCEPRISIQGYGNLKQWSTWQPDGSSWTFKDDGYTRQVWNHVEDTY